jgi:hypothetical protein
MAIPDPRGEEFKGEPSKDALLRGPISLLGSRSCWGDEAPHRAGDIFDWCGATTHARCRRVQILGVMS